MVLLSEMCGSLYYLFLKSIFKITTLTSQQVGIAFQSIINFQLPTPAELNMNSPEIYLGVSILKTDIGGQHCFKIDAYESTEISLRFIYGNLLLATI